MIEISVGTNLNLTENALCHFHNGSIPDGATRLFECGIPLRGCVVSVQRTHPLPGERATTPISLGEVRVYGNKTIKGKNPLKHTSNILHAIH